MNLVIAALFRPNGPNFDLFKTDESDIILAHDYMLPLPRLNSEGLRVVVYWLDLNKWLLGTTW